MLGIELYPSNLIVSTINNIEKIVVFSFKNVNVYCALKGSVREK